MPIKADIDMAIAAGDRSLAEALYAEVLGKKGGLGLSGHDQQLLTAQIESLPLPEPEPEPAPKPAKKKR